MFAHPRVPVLSKSVSVSLQLSYFPVSDGGDIQIPQTKRPAEYGRVSPFVDKKWMHQVVHLVNYHQFPETSSLPTITIEHLKLVLVTWPLEFHTQTPKPRNHTMNQQFLTTLSLTGYLKWRCYNPYVVCLTNGRLLVFFPQPLLVVEFVSPYQAIPDVHHSFHHLSVPLKRLELSNISLARWSNASNSDGCA